MVPSAASNNFKSKIKEALVTVKSFGQIKQKADTDFQFWKIYQISKCSPQVSRMINRRIWNVLHVRLDGFWVN